MNIMLFIAIGVAAIFAELTYLLVKQQNLSGISRGGKRQILVDTSVLIDGRIITIAKSGFVGGILTIPRSVIGELQLLADGSDHDKRERARYGLDVVKMLQEMPDVSVQILTDNPRAHEGVDERLLSLAKKYRAVLLTIDFNLSKVAEVEGVIVLNINELAQGLRMAYLPGEMTLLELVQKGHDNHQAVGYLSDGTMVVVEHASKYIGQAKNVEFIRALQTSAGKMMFAKLVGESQSPVKAQKTETPRSSKPAEQIRQAARPKVQTARQPKNVEKVVAAPRPVQDGDRGRRAAPAGKPKRVDHEASLMELVDKQN